MLDPGSSQTSVSYNHCNDPDACRSRRSWLVLRCYGRIKGTEENHGKPVPTVRPKFQPVSPGKQNSWANHYATIHSLVTSFNDAAIPAQSTEHLLHNLDGCESCRGLHQATIHVKFQSYGIWSRGDRCLRSTSSGESASSIFGVLQEGSARALLGPISRWRPQAPPKLWYLHTTHMASSPRSVESSSALPWQPQI